MINDRYVVDAVIGEGSSGTVYKASRLMMGTSVAIKVIDRHIGEDPGSLDRLLRELKAAETLRHPHVITVWESGVTDDGKPFLVMDFLEGITLGDLLKKHGCLEPLRALKIIKQVVDALGHAHEKGLIHKDMKPDNVVLEERSGDYAKVLDFGIASTPQESISRVHRPKTVAGSPAYMSPEQCQGFHLDFRSDLYSVAIMFYEMLTGRRPFIAPDLSKLMYKTVTETPPLMKRVKTDIEFPDLVEVVVAKALSKDPENRQSSIRLFGSELEAAYAATEFGTVIQKPAAPPEPVPNPVATEPARQAQQNVVAPPTKDGAGARKIGPPPMPPPSKKTKPKPKPKQ